MPQQLFVYGSLLAGNCPPDLMLSLYKQINARIPAYIYASLHDLGPYPAVRLRPRGYQRVYGEIWRFADWRPVIQCLDAYEDYDPGKPHASEYKRQLVVAFSARRTLRSWTYRYNPVYFRHPISSGDYRQYLANMCKMRG